MLFSNVLKYGFFVHSGTECSKNQLEYFRIAIAAFALVSFSVLLIDYRELLHPEGIINWEVSEANTFWFEIHFQKIARAINADNVTVLIAAIILYYCSLLFLLAGVLTRFCSVLSFILYYTFSNEFSNYGYGADIYLNLSLLFLTFFPVGYDLALTKRKQYKDLDAIRGLSIRCLRIYLMITYFSAGWQKAVIPEWWNGNFMFQVFSDPSLCTLQVFASSIDPLVYKLISWSILISELGYPLFVWIPKVRTLVVFSVMLMHLFIIFCLSMPFFGVIMILLNLCCFYPEIISDVRRIVNKVKYKL